MPMQTLDAVFDLEEKILEKNYEDAVITYLFTLKGTSGDIGEVMKRVFGDEVLSLFNWDGRCGKKSLSELKIVSVALFEIFKLHGRIDFEKEVRKSVEQSHNRQKQKRYSKRNVKKFILTTMSHKSGSFLELSSTGTWKHPFSKSSVVNTRAPCNLSSTSSMMGIGKFSLENSQRRLINCCRRPSLCTI
ncbi:uncharacterized protein LOC126766232 [Bactrocera neohumeralis]|uniref:uncharacterized protein LOC126766232 n=1 Tax=Bactrocera neohumeralis TaxID=98809 RepID=UPI002165232F|nr:uncharacterized protein LOC126766232 [Bactrocera neohumeralis]